MSYLSLMVMKMTNSEGVFFELQNYEREVGEEIILSNYWLITSVFIQTENRGKGLARKLLEEAIAEIRVKSSLPIKIWCESQDPLTDNERLADFYESLGFRATGLGEEMELF